MMNKYEKISISLALIALIISIISPIITFLYLNSFELEKRYSSKIAVITIDHETKEGYVFEIVIWNHGKTISEKILVHLMPFADYILLPDEPVVITDPLSPIEIQRDDKTLILKISRVLGAGERIILSILNICKPEIAGKGLIICKVYDQNGEADTYSSMSIIDVDVLDFDSRKKDMIDRLEKFPYK